MRFFHFRCGAFYSGRTNHSRNVLRCPGPSQMHFPLIQQRDFRLFALFCRKSISRGGMKIHLARARSVAFAVGDSAILMAEMESTSNFGSRKARPRASGAKKKNRCLRTGEKYSSTGTSIPGFPGTTFASTARQSQRTHLLSLFLSKLMIRNNSINFRSNYCNNGIIIVDTSKGTANIK